MSIRDVNLCANLNEKPKLNLCLLFLRNSLLQVMYLELSK